MGILVTAAIIFYQRMDGRGETHQITIVNVGSVSRNELGRQLRTIISHNPEIIGFDILFNQDSLDRDSVLAAVLQRYHRTAQVVTLHKFNEELYMWDSLEASHPKFPTSTIGFANISLKDSVLIPAVPMQQIWKDSLISPFALAIAKQLGRVNPLYAEGGFGFIEFTLTPDAANYNRIELSDIVSGDYRKVELEGKIVLLGYLGPKEDFLYLDEKKTQRVSGIEVHAALLNQVLSRP
ncbi:MAG: CHASE2 domain-containing protein [Bacteroidota bacterium]